MDNQGHKKSLTTGNILLLLFFPPSVEHISAHPHRFSFPRRNQRQTTAFLLKFCSKWFSAAPFPGANLRRRTKRKADGSSMRIWKDPASSRGAQSPKSVFQTVRPRRRRRRFARDHPDARCRHFAHSVRSDWRMTPTCSLHLFPLADPILVTSVVDRGCESLRSSVEAKGWRHFGFVMRIISNNHHRRGNDRSAPERLFEGKQNLAANRS
jgi:hypothetical protein